MPQTSLVAICSTTATTLQIPLIVITGTNATMQLRNLCRLFSESNADP